MKILNYLASFFFGVSLAFIYFGTLLLSLKKFLINKKSLLLLFVFFFRFIFMSMSIFLMFKLGKLFHILLFFTGFLITAITYIVFQNLNKRQKTYEN